MIVDGVAPRRVAIPEDGASFASLLAAATRDRERTVIRGGGSKIGWGRPPASVDLVVSTAKLDRLIAHRHGDLTATVQAGMPLAALNAALRSERQWLPVESAFPEATVGGIVATNDSGPSRHRNGTPRDLVIGITLALTDGRVVKAGGTVVKNVAGYDLGKLVSASHGTLAGIVDVTFKLVPIPAASATLAVVYSSPAALAEDVATLAASQVEPAAFDVRADLRSDGESWSLLVRVATSPAATDAQISAAGMMVRGDAAVLTGDGESAAWEGQIRDPWHGGVDDAVVRFSWLPTSLAQVLTLVGEIRRSGVPVLFVARALGSGFLRLGGDTAAQASAVARLRANAALGHVVVLRGGAALKAAVDVWGPARDSDPVARSLKQMFDPAGVLNAGRGPI